MNEIDPAKNRSSKVAALLQHTYLGDQFVQDLIHLLKNEESFDPAAISNLGWIAIDTDNDGQFLCHEEELIENYSKIHKIDAIYATSLAELERAKDGKVWLVRIPEFDAFDLNELNHCLWIFHINQVAAKELIWYPWDYSIFFTKPLEFAWIRLREGYGHTTLVGPQNFINFILEKTKPDCEEGEDTTNWPQWTKWPKNNEK